MYKQKPVPKKVCAECGKEFYPVGARGHGRSKYCVTCKGEVHKRQRMETYYKKKNKK